MKKQTGWRLWLWRIVDFWAPTRTSMYAIGKLPLKRPSPWENEVKDAG